MQKKTRLLAAGGAAALLALGGLAGLAHADKSGWGGGHGMMSLRAAGRRVTTARGGVWGMSRTQANRPCMHAAVRAASSVPIRASTTPPPSTVPPSCLTALLLQAPASLLQPPPPPPPLAPWPR